MSTKIGTLQAPTTTRSIWPAAVIASLLLLTVGIGAFFLGRDQATPTAKTVIAGTAADTPTQIIGGTDGSSWLAVAMTPAMQEAIVAAREAAEASGELSAGTSANTPSELNGGAFERSGRHQRI